MNRRQSCDPSHSNGCAENFFKPSPFSSPKLPKVGIQLEMRDTTPSHMPSLLAIPVTREAESETASSTGSGISSSLPNSGFASTLSLFLTYSISFDTCQSYAKNRHDGRSKGQYLLSLNTASQRKTLPTTQTLD